MCLISDEEFISSLIGSDIQPVEISVAGKIWHGFSIIDYGDNPLNVRDALSIEALRPKRRKFIEENWRICHERDIRLWSRSGINVSAFPKLPVVDIAIHEKVGHLSYIDDYEQNRIIEIIQTIYSMAPFEIISAEESYMDARFINDISLEQAKMCQRLIFEVSIDVLNDLSFMLQDSDNIYDNDLLAKVIVRNNHFWLHWG